MYLISEKASSEIRGRDVLIPWLWRHALVFVAPQLCYRGTWASTMLLGRIEGGVV